MIFLVMFIMCNPSNGGTDKSDQTINRILRAADAKMFGHDRWIGVYIRNLFTLRSPDPKDVETAFKKQMEKYKKENNLKEVNEACRDHALSELQVGSGFKEWTETAKKCKRVIVAWGDCGSNLKEIQWAKDKVTICIFTLC